jgi:pimeloyl-ACP methyl ester carboxylesterase
MADLSGSAISFPRLDSLVMEDVSIEVPGGAINVWHRPAQDGSPTAVLIHGLTGNSRWWTRVIDLLPGEIGLIVMDVRGRGASLSAPAPYDMATIADDVLRALDHLDVERAVVVGYSMGAWIAAIFDSRHPERVERLVLVDGGLPLPGDPGADADQVIEAMVGPALARLGRVFASEEDFFDYWQAHPALERHWDEAMRPALGFELVAAPEGFTVGLNPDAVRESAREITVDPATNGAGARVTANTYLIVVERGTADQLGGMVPREVAEATAADTPHMRVEYLPGINHYTLVLGAGAPAVAAAITAA